MSKGVEHVVVELASLRRLCREAMEIGGEQGRRLSQMGRDAEEYVSLPDDESPEALERCVTRLRAAATQAHLLALELAFQAGRLDHGAAVRLSAEHGGPLQCGAHSGRAPTR